MVRGFEVVIDDTNLNPKTLEHIKELVLNVDSNVDIRYNLFNTPLIECVTRVEKRNASLPKDEQIPISVVLDSENNNYYKGINFKIYMQKDNEQIEIGDGGFVDWIGKMTGSKKNRCLISGLGLERLLLL